MKTLAILSIVLLLLAATATAYASPKVPMVSSQDQGNVLNSGSLGLKTVPVEPPTPYQSKSPAQSNSVNRPGIGKGLNIEKATPKYSTPIKQVTNIKLPPFFQEQVPFFKRLPTSPGIGMTGALASFASKPVGVSSIVDPTWKPQGARSIVDPTFKPQSGQKGIIDPSFKPQQGTQEIIDPLFNKR